MMPSTVWAPASVLRTLTLRRSPAGASHTTGGVLSSEGVVPTAPPAWMGLSSWMVSLPLKTVLLSVRTLVRRRSFSLAGQGKYSYCQPDRGLTTAPAGIEVENWNWGIRELRGFAAASARCTRRRRRAAPRGSASSPSGAPAALAGHLEVDLVRSGPSDAEHAAGEVLEALGATESAAQRARVQRVHAPVTASTMHQSVVAPLDFPRDVPLRRSEGSCDQRASDAPGDGRDERAHWGALQQRWRAHDGERG